MKRVLVLVISFLLMMISEVFASDINVSAVPGTGYLYISGNAGTDNFGDDIIILINDVVTDNIVYIDSCTISESGEYSKKISVEGHNISDLTVKLRCGGEDVTHTMTVKKSSRYININGVYNTQNKKINIMIDNIRDSANTVDFFVASYGADGRLLYVRNFKGSYSKSSKVQTLTFDYEAPEETAQIKILAWENENITPVSDSDYQKYIDLSEISDRYTDEEIKETADELFSNLTIKDITKSEIYSAYINGDYKTALILYRNYMIDRFRRIEYEPDSLQQSSSYTNEYYYGSADVVVGYRELDDLNDEFVPTGLYPAYVDYENVLDFLDTEDKSAVNWCIKPGNNTSSLVQSSLQHLFLRLGVRYTQTGDEIYVKKLLQLMEDFADNYSGQWDRYYGVENISYEERGNNMDKYGNEIYAYNNVASNAATYLSLRSQRLNCFIYSLVLACKALPAENETKYSINAYKDFYAKAFDEEVTEEGLKIIDPVRFAKMMNQLYQEELPTIAWSVLNKEGGTMNITADAYLNSIKLFGMFYGFDNYDGLDQKLFEKAEEFFGDVIAEDGGFIETSFNYNKLTAEQIKNTNFLLVATKSYPQTRSYAQMTDAWDKLMVGYTSPLGLIPNIGNLYNNYGTKAFWLDEEAKTEQAEKLESQDYTSVYYPYSGYGVMRNGWGIDDFYMSFFTNPLRGTGHKFVGTNAVMNVTAYGRTLLLCGGVPWYSREHAGVYTEFLEKGYDEINSYFGENSSRKASTVMVNGKSQADMNYNFDDEGKMLGSGTIRKAVSGEPLGDRFFSGSYFDFGEGTYDNAYTVFDTEKALYPDISTEDGITKDAIHNRQFIFAKESNIFVVIDNLENCNGSKNEYSTMWHFPAYEKGSSTLTGFSEEQVKYDAKNNKIYTCDIEGPNIFLHSLSRRPLEYKKYYGYFKEGEAGFGWSNGGSSNYSSTGRYLPRNEVHVKWNDRNPGDRTQLITLIAPSENTEDPVVEIVDNSNAYLGTSRYVVETNNSSKLYISSDVKCHSVYVNEKEIKAKTVIYTEKDGKINGIIIDAERIDGESIIGSMDFSVDNGEIVLGNVW